MVDVNPARRYSSSLRQEGARRTRELLLDAAEELFLAHGYVRTTVELIAERAGVSRPTVFANLGNKRTILTLVRDRALAGDDAPVPVIARPWYQEALLEPDPARSLRLHARNVGRIHQRAAGLNEVLRHAAAADAELVELWQASEDRRRIAASTMIDSVMTKGPLRPGLDRDTAVDVLWVLTASETYLRLVRGRGWTDQQYQDWLADTYRDQFLGPATPP